MKNSSEIQFILKLSEIIQNKENTVYSSVVIELLKLC